MSKRLGIIITVLLVTALAAGCGGGGATEETSTAGSSDVQRIEVTATEFEFTPNTFTVERGVPVEIVLKNDGSIKHNLLIDALGVNSELVDPGQSVTVSFTPDEAGEYEIHCNEPGHQPSGMVGTLTVQG